MRYIKRLTGISLAVFLIGLFLQSCSNAANAPQASTETAGDKPKNINIAYSSTGRPMNFTNANGEADGYEVSVLKEIDKLLPQYEFTFVPTTDDTDLLIGIETGKYDLGVKGAWVTDERREKYIFPKTPIGASSIGLLYRASDSSKYSNLEGFAQSKGKLVPIAPQNAQYNVILEFNKAHPDTPVELVASETFGVADAYRWVIEGRYDGFFETKTGYLKNIEEAESPYHEYQGQLLYSVYRALPTWPLFNKANQAVADAYDEAYSQLLSSGKINELMLKYLNENTFQYITEDEYQYLKP